MADDLEYVPQTTALAGKKILLVDDDPDILATLQAAFEPTGAQLMSTSNGNKAVELASRETPDLMILDMMLPGRSGFLVLEKVKTGKLPSDKPYVIMITGNEGMRHRLFAEARGVNEYFHKPVSLDKLLDAANRLLSDE